MYKRLKRIVINSQTVGLFGIYNCCQQCEKEKTKDNENDF